MSIDDAGQPPTETPAAPADKAELTRRVEETTEAVRAASEADSSPTPAKKATKRAAKKAAPAAGAPAADAAVAKKAARRPAKKAATTETNEAPDGRDELMRRVEETTEAVRAASEADTPPAPAKRTRKAAAKKVPAAPGTVADAAAPAKRTRKAAAKKVTATPVVAPAPIAQPGNPAAPAAPQPEPPSPDPAEPSTPQAPADGQHAGTGGSSPADTASEPGAEIAPDTVPEPAGSESAAPDVSPEGADTAQPAGSEVSAEPVEPAPAVSGADVTTADLVTSEVTDLPAAPDEAPEPTSTALVEALPDGQTPVSTSVPAAATPAGSEVSQDALAAVVDGWSYDPHGVLGAHRLPEGWAVRTLRPDAVAVAVLDQDGTRHEARQVFRGGVFEARLPQQPGDYRVEVVYPDGSGGTNTYTVDDPYRWLPTLGQLDQHLIREGRHEELWKVLGAHVRGYDTPGGRVEGVSFAVWAPNARGVKVTGDFDYWEARAYPMRSLGSSGVWEIFVPGAQVGTRYRFHILGADGQWLVKSDPMAFATEVPPANASVVTASTHEWQDADWLAARAEGNWHARPMSVYEVHLGSWRQGLSYRELADELVAYVKDAGFTHLEFLPVAEHPFGGSWGYQVTSYYAPTSRFGSPDDLRYLIDTAHQAGIGVIVDWVPGHFPKDEWALARFDGAPLYEHGDPRRGEQLDWGTNVFDFGRSEVRNFLVANALFWLKEFHVDGIRVDAVASMLYLDYSRPEGQWVPNEYGGRENLEAVAFLQEFNATVYREVPGAITIAEESTSWPGVTRPTHLGGLGFGFKWNMGWMHDSLDYMSTAPIYRSYHHNQLTFSLVYAFSENFVLPISHDEVVYGKGSLIRKMPGDRWQQLANVRAYLAFMWAHPGKQLLFMGSEFGQLSEWAESRSLDWWHLDDPAHRGVLDLVRDLNTVYGEHEALYTQDNDPAGFQWIDANDSQGNTLTFLRFGKDGQALACVSNFSGQPHAEYRIGLPRGGRWREVINTDFAGYGGSGSGNLGGIEAVPESWHGQPFSATLTAPPLGTVWFVHEGPEPELPDDGQAADPALTAAAEASGDLEAAGLVELPEHDRG
ncbi:1,4-alpha-glucan branching protein GlgB [Modestobacter sp. VKM Ac-2986]|uniref:1,4-alpha-glucan branching protein GlgB n=1 Tax=Modestobacter sp. VKM Ac-2986 TaxID=3004140 RepID=UPI0022AB9A9C|nr:1,4-alpha-glucan branching protein GlgB [Modestobacter sp. VKM Ac-2986]MCZ2829551.1 1,4-alpha-glucan branching protein GlgB [Modestobacter sp. VKM Ac-2986]